MKTENLILAAIALFVFDPFKLRNKGSAVGNANRKMQAMAVKISRQLNIPLMEVIVRGEKKFTFFWEGNQVTAAKKLKNYLAGQGKTSIDFDLDSDSTVLYLDA